DLLLAADSLESCKTSTEDLLRELDVLGYKVSAKKVQICLGSVIYLGYQLRE
ncbi:pol polyprotein, partial [Lynx pardinus]